MRDKLYFFSPYFIPWKVDVSEAQILKTSVEKLFDIIAFPLCQLCSSLINSADYSGPEDLRRLPHTNCSYVFNTPTYFDLLSMNCDFSVTS